MIKVSLIDGDVILKKSVVDELFYNLDKKNDLIIPIADKLSLPFTSKDIQKLVQFLVFETVPNDLDTLTKLVVVADYLCLDTQLSCLLQKFVMQILKIGEENIDLAITLMKKHTRHPCLKEIITKKKISQLIKEIISEMVTRSQTHNDDEIYLMSHLLLYSRFEITVDQSIYIYHLISTIIYNDLTFLKLNYTIYAGCLLV